ncbi:MAG TPA: DsrE/DsrF/DrsH-like family protein [Nitrospiria bacterium]|jgi:peroxiredoxin family protein
MDPKLKEGLDPALEEKIKGLVDERIEEWAKTKLFSILEKKPTKKKGRLAIIVSKGTLEAAYPPLILATTAIALNMEVGIFFTFFGLHILKKGSAETLKFVPLGNPATPMPMPNIISALPGMTELATVMMKKTISKKNITSVPELLNLAKETGVTLWPCNMTMEMMGIKYSDLIDGLAEPVGAATFLSYAKDSDISLFI